MSRFTVSVSPHIRSGRTTSSVMLDVILALMPAAVCSVVVFGLRALLLILVSVTASVAAEYIFNKIIGKGSTVGDLSAVVTGLLLSMNVPATLPVWQLVIGDIISVVIVKGLFGGIGQNFANPAITARIALLISFSTAMTTPGIPLVMRGDAVSSATPLALLSGSAAKDAPSFLSQLFGSAPAGETGLTPVKMLFGMHPSSALGEGFAVALLLGGIYLAARKVITWHTPVTFMATVAVFALIFGQDPFYQLFSGGVMLGSIFMATDYATTPTANRGKVIFGFGCGLLTMIIRTFGNYPEGVSFSILFMNILTPFIDQWTLKTPTWEGKKHG